MSTMVATYQAHQVDIRKKLSYSFEELQRIRVSVGTTPMVKPTSKNNATATPTTAAPPSHIFMDHKNSITPVPAATAATPLAKAISFLSDDERSTLQQLRERMRKHREAQQQQAATTRAAAVETPAPPAPAVVVPPKSTKRDASMNTRPTYTPTDKLALTAEAIVASLKPWWLQAWPYSPYYYPVLVPIPTPVVQPPPQANPNKKKPSAKKHKTKTTKGPKEEVKKKEEAPVTATVAEATPAPAPKEKEAPKKRKNRRAKGEGKKEVSDAAPTAPVVEEAATPLVTPPVVETVVVPDEAPTVPEKEEEVVVPTTTSAPHPAQSNYHARRKQVAYGMRTRAYSLWLHITSHPTEPPQHSFLRSDISLEELVAAVRAIPARPDTRAVCSKRQWDANLKVWRRALHTLDVFITPPVKEAATEAEATDNEEKL
jgi:hypothetical protein